MGRFITKGRGSGRRVIPIKDPKMRAVISRSQYFDYYLDTMTDNELRAYISSWTNFQEHRKLMEDWATEDKQEAIENIGSLFPYQNIPSAKYLDIVDDKDKIHDRFELVINNLSTKQFQEYVMSYIDLNFSVVTMKHWDDKEKADSLDTLKKFVKRI